MAILRSANEGRKGPNIRLYGLLLVGIVLLGGVYLAWHFRDGISHPRSALEPLIALQLQAPIRMALAFFMAEILITALSVPVEILLAVAAGALFGLVEGTLLVSFGAGIGASLSFLISRFLLRRPVQRHFASQLERIDEGIEGDGAAYLVSLRLLPVFPFALVNILMGVTAMRLPTFYVVSQIGMLPALILYVNAGTQIAQVDELAGIVSPGMIAALVGLAALPWIAKAGLALWRSKRGKPNDI